MRPPGQFGFERFRAWLRRKAEPARRTELAFEGKVVLVRDIGLTADGARNVIVTFLVVRALSGVMPKYVIVETRTPPAPDLRPGFHCVVHATAEAGAIFDGLAPATVCGVRDARIRLAAAAA